MSANAIASAIKEGLSLWKTYLSTRQEAYERKMDKRKAKAIEYGERIVLRVQELKIEDRQVEGLIKKFFKYNN